VGLERGPLSLVSTIEERLGRRSSCSGLRNREYDRKDSSCSPCNILYPRKLALTSLTSGNGSVGRVCLRTEATEFVFVWSALWENGIVMAMQLTGSWASHSSQSCITA
jgi:hypothetical protein